MAKIAIYDQYYQSTDYPRADIVGRALEGTEHRVVGVASDIHRAARQILDFAGTDRAECPDVIIMGGMLDGQYDYRQRPVTDAESCTIRRRTLLGNSREEVARRVTFLLPQFAEDGSYHFPSIVLAGKAPDDPPEALLQQWRAGMSGVAARILSRVVQTYLPQTGRIGVSGDPMFDAVLSVPEVDRNAPNAVQQLQGHIQTLTCQ